MTEQNVIEDNFDAQVTLGDQNMIHDSIFNEGVTAGNYTHIQNSTIHGGLRLEGTHCIVTGCYIVGNNEHGILIDGGHNYQPRERFPDEVTEKAWKLLEDHMTPDQHFAFMEKSTIELENDANTFRLLINKDGKFTILEGKRGAGIAASTGRISSHDYPLGDEIAAFLDWFRFKTKELISQWNCGTYGIVKEGQRR